VTGPSRYGSCRGAGRTEEARRSMPTSDTLEFNPYLPEVHEDPYPLYGSVALAVRWSGR